MPAIDLIDETYVAVAPERLVDAVADPGLWRRWFPGLARQVFMDRGVKGVRWSVTGEIDGSVEVWLEPAGPGTIVHWYVRGEHPGASMATRLRREYLRAVNQGMFALKDAAEEAGLA